MARICLVTDSADLQPELVFVGGHIGNGILAGTVVNSFNKEGINEETITKNGTKVVANRVFNGLGNSAVKATQNVAGKKFVVSGANKVSESVIQGTVMMGEKTTDVIINENKQ